jgi:hypoxia up-regulated 1
VRSNAVYPAGMKWTNPSGKSQHQQLWTGASALGASAKEFTFTNLNDFEVEFYQSVPLPQSPEISLDRAVSVLLTKNLSASVAELQEKYSCESPDIFFKVSARLASEDGEIDVVKAGVECEAEVLEKETFVDGVKNLFGFGKKDQEPIADGEDTSASSSETSTAGTETATGSSSSSPSLSSSEATESSEAATTDSQKKVPTRKLIVIPVTFELKKAGIPQLSKAAVTDLKDRLKAFEASDQGRRLREETLNQLEGYTYKVRDLLDNEKFLACATASEKADLEKKNKAASEWLYGKGADAPQKDLKAKISELQAAVNPIVFRMDEGETRPALVTELQKALKESREYIQTQKKQIEEYDAFHASVSRKASPSSSVDAESASPVADDESSTSTQTTNSLGVTPAPTPESDFAGLEDEEPVVPDIPEHLQQKGGLKMEDVLKERGPVPPMYMLEDLKEVELVEAATSAWLKEMLAKQEKLGVTDDPVLNSKELTDRREKLSKAGLDLAMKGVANFNKRTKSESANGSSKTKSSKTKKPKSSKTKKGGPPGAHTIELKPKADGTFDDDEIAEMLRQYGVEKEYREARGDGDAEEAAAKAKEAGQSAEGGEVPEGIKLGEAKSDFKAGGVKHEEL